MILVTGGAGFIGANFVLDWLERTGEGIVNLDKLTYAGNLGSLAALRGDARHLFVHGDIGDRAEVDALLARHRPRAVVNFAAESHVDRSIHGPRDFIETNVLGTFNLLEAVRARPHIHFHHVSTDEVYGSLGPTGLFTETTPLDPSSPYSSSKASADLITLAYERTFGLDVVVTRCSNNYGPYQFPEKLIPLMVANAINDKPLPVYGDGTNVRDWLHVEDHCQALTLALEKGKKGQVYNIGGGAERQNIQIVKAVLGLLGKPESLIKYVTDRLGHDLRYAIDPTKIKRELGWAPAHTFEQGLAETVKWYVDHRTWWERVTSGAYRQYFDTQYQSRLAGS